MSASTIEWTDETWNPVTGCSRVSAGCDHCYAVRQSHRNEAIGHEKYRGLTVLSNKGDRHFNGVVRTHNDTLNIPLRRRKPTRYFVNSMSDLFHEAVPFEFIDKVFAVMALCPQHTFQILTKRPERMAEYLCDDGTPIGRAHEIIKCANDRMLAGEGVWPGWPLPNVWLGTSCEDQAAADERIPHLLKCQAAVRFLSCEPLLGPIDLESLTSGANWINCLANQWTARTDIDSWNAPDAVSVPGDSIEPLGTWGVNWVIVGGESGPGARHCHTEWIRSILRDCRSAGVPAFVKQLGSKPVMSRSEWSEITISDSWTSFADEPNGLGVAKLPTRKGGEPIEWPDDLRVREFPAVLELREGATTAP